MPYNVTSWFIDTLASRSFASGGIVRKLYVGSQDLSNYVTKWPQISRKWNDIRTQTITVPLAGQSRDLNWLVNSALTIRKSAALELGLLTDSGTVESISMFNGTIQTTGNNDGNVSVTLVNKFKQLSERVIGSPNSAYNYTSSNHLISDFAWYVITSHGGYDATQSTSNVDIHYSNFLSWAGVFSADNVTIQAYLDGAKCAEVLKAVGDMTQSAIYEEEGKVNFRRFTTADSYVSVIDNTNDLKSHVELSDRDMVNTMKVAAGYDVDSRYFTITVQDVSSASVSSYGLKEDVYDNAKVWFVDSVSALNLAQRTTLVNGVPRRKVTPTTLLHGFLRQVGETISYNDNLMQVNGGFRIMEYKKNMDSGFVEFVIDDSQIQGAFTLDYSALDSSDVLL